MWLCVVNAPTLGDGLMKLDSPTGTGKRRWLLSLICVLAVTFNVHAAEFDLTTASVADINAAFDKGTLTSEKLVKLYLARIDAYDHKGPKINAVLALNAKALETARALDKERKEKGPRSPLHGIPVIAKDV